MKRILLTLISTTALAATGCADNTSCAGDDECFMGEVCVEDVCQRPDDDENNANNANNANNDTVQSNAPNNTSNNDDNNGSSNNVPGNNDNNSTNNASNNTNNSTSTNNMTRGGACSGDAFDSCEADQDASTPTHIVPDSPLGCVQPNDDFAGGVAAAAAVICPLEDSDRFTFTVNPCATTAYVLDVEVVPRDTCPPNIFDIDVSLNGNDCDSNNGLVECSDRAIPGARTASLVVEPSTSTRVLYLDVLPQEENLLFEYDVTVTFRQ